MPGGGNGGNEGRMRSVTAALDWIERALLAVATTFLLAIMLLVVTDVFLRYVVGRPLTFTYDLVGVYLMTGVFFFTLSHAQGQHVHVAVDILVSRAAERGRLLADLATCAVGAAVFTLVAYAGYGRAYDNYVSQDVLAGIIPWPTWVATAMVPLGCGVIVLRFVVTALNHLLSLATGRAAVGLPTLNEAGVKDRVE